MAYHTIFTCTLLELYVNSQTAISHYSGEDYTAYSLQHRFRQIKKDATDLKGCQRRLHSRLNTVYTAQTQAQLNA